MIRLFDFGRSLHIAAAQCCRAGRWTGGFNLSWRHPETSRRKT